MNEAQQKKLTPKELRMAQKQAKEAAAKLDEDENDFAKERYGKLPKSSEHNNNFVHFSSLVNKTDEFLNHQVTVRCYLQGVRDSAKMAFLRLRQTLYMAQAMASVGENVSKPMLRFISSIPKESLVEITGKLVPAEIKSDSMSLKNAEIHLESIYVVNEASSTLPFQIDDAARPEDGPESLPRVNLDTRLNNRVLDLKTSTNHAIFAIQNGVAELFAEFLRSRGFKQIFSPKLIGAASEGGANVFRVQYFGTNAFLAQSPQFYKQMAIAAGMERVYEIGPVFRAENSFTHRHLTEFVGLDLEMAFNEHYHEVMLLIAEMLIFIFKTLPQR